MTAVAWHAILSLLRWLTQLGEQTMPVAYGSTTLPAGIRSRFVRDMNGLEMHVLEAGFESRGRPCVLLLHGFPELAYSWRKVMVPIASAGDPKPSMRANA